METGTAISVKYWTSTDHPADFYDRVEGIDDFQSNLAENYISVVKGRPSGAGGGTSFFVEIISNFSLSHFVQLILDGVAFDLVKHGTKAFVLRPFIAAYTKLLERNDNHHIDMTELRIEFQDSSIIIHSIFITNFIDHLNDILITLAENYKSLSINCHEYPDRIHIPVFEDQDKDRPYRFRVIGYFDETISAKGPQDFFGFWGLEYDKANTVRVYDVKRQLLIDDNFGTLEQYYRACELRRISKIKDSGATE